VVASCGSFTPLHRCHHPLDKRFQKASSRAPPAGLRSVLAAHLPPARRPSPQSGSCLEIGQPRLAAIRSGQARYSPPGSSLAEGQRRQVSASTLSRSGPLLLDPRRGRQAAATERALPGHWRGRSHAVRPGRFPSQIWAFTAAVPACHDRRGVTSQHPAPITCSASISVSLSPAVGSEHASLVRNHEALLCSRMFCRPITTPPVLFEHRGQALQRAFDLRAGLGG